MSLSRSPLNSKPAPLHIDNLFSATENRVSNNVSMSLLADFTLFSPYLFDNKFKAVVCEINVLSISNEFYAGSNLVRGLSLQADSPLFSPSMEQSASSNKLLLVTDL